MTSETNKTTKPLVIIVALFFIFGFVTWANGTLIPFFKLSFGLSNTQAFFVTFASYIAYFFLALPSSWILKKTGFKNGIIVGLLILGLGSLVFIPAAETRSFPLFLAGIFIQGAALALLQTAANPYLIIIGPIESAAKRISIAGICNKFAGMIVPIIMGSLFLKNAAEIEKKIADATGIEKENILADVLSRVNTPYIVLAIIFCAFALLIKYTHLPEVEVEEDIIDETKGEVIKHKSIFQFPHLFLGAFCIFVYVAAEVMAGDIIGVYGKALGIAPDTAKYLTSLTLFSMLVGYVVGIFTIPKYISQQKALRICAILGIVFCTLAFLTASSQLSVIFIALLGLSNSLMWPAIFPLGINHLGKFTKTGSAIMIMGIAGGAIWPLIYGYLSDLPSHGGLGVPFHIAFYIAILPCYLYILFFAIKGHKIGVEHKF
ncbi:glucose/galactose transporter [Flavobacterium swingsii]|jgi:FHS family L-fucose permease-like MFS transporter|uniref:Glucose/galactose transporter n=1 Tax=Flavobacterium swingsii TaxID=498292 RepID=A0A1I0ZPN0_9FLAO|nr:sugar MFS transporter [Flavobacterium swingsii]SFB27477.1 glucose/galactose transporter [Flavobacterium swingsii]